jgi:hypothetical protein
LYPLHCLTTRKFFHKNSTDKDIKIQVQQKLSKENHFIGTYIVTHGSYDFVIIKFSNYDTLQKYNKEKHPTLNTTIDIFNNKNINEYINNQCHTQDNNMIKIVDIPIYYDTQTLIQHVANITGKTIQKYVELTKKPNTRLNRNNQRSNNRNNSINNGPSTSRASQKFTRPAIYKQILITFEDSNVQKYIFDSDKWCIPIENFAVRILPAQINSAEYQKRTSYSYTITGLPLNTNYLDIQPLMKYLNGKTCTFKRTNKFSTSKSAIMYVAEKDFNKQKTSTTMFDHEIFILPNHKDQFCLNCRSPKHVIKNCTSDKFQMVKDRKDNTKEIKIFTKRIIKKERTTIKINEEINNNFGHIMTMNRHNSQMTNQHRTPYKKGPKSTSQSIKSNKNKQNIIQNPPRTHIPFDNNNSTQNKTIIELREQLLKAEKTIDTMQRRMATLENTIQSQHMKHQELNNSVVKNESLLTEFNLKSNTMASQITELGNKMNIIILGLTNTNNGGPSFPEDGTVNSNNRCSDDTIKDFALPNQKDLPSNYYSTFTHNNNAEETQSTYQSENGGQYSKLMFNDPVTPQNYTNDEEEMHDYDDENDYLEDNADTQPSGWGLTSKVIKFFN